ncbi:two-component response regulator 24-like [Cornus florida]|uniref:two-component response regulator 24-like n=1 Tax=Cornus florida TaxID=4283 RepID=UPI0028A1B3D8|nr:two-component response regulator 24-like [Cornus florida]
MVFGKGGSSSRSTKTIDGSNRRFSALIVDDDPIIRRIHTALLNKHGFETQLAENGREALDLFRAGASFDLVLMDRDMPVMDGPQATRELRAMGVTSMIVGVTTRARDSEKQAFLGAGLNELHEKPLNAAKVNTLLHELSRNY